jgi:hypothetical protein
MKARDGYLPVLHISAHGNDDGIQLSDKTILNWNDLRDLLLPINKALKGALILCMSSCSGFLACTMAMHPEGENHVFFEVVGNTGSPTWSETAVAYAAFYHLLAKGKTSRFRQGHVRCFRKRGLATFSASSRTRSS